MGSAEDPEAFWNLCACRRLHTTYCPRWVCTFAHVWRRDFLFVEDASRSRMVEVMCLARRAGVFPVSCWLVILRAPRARVAVQGLCCAQDALLEVGLAVLHFNCVAQAHPRSQRTGKESNIRWWAESNQRAAPRAQATGRTRVWVGRPSSSPAAHACRQAPHPRCCWRGRFWDAETMSRSLCVCE